MLVLIKGAGDLATGIALRLLRSGLSVVMTDIARPSAIRRTVAFSEAVYNNEAAVEGFRAEFAPDAASARSILAKGSTPVMVDESGSTALTLCPAALVDAIIAKRNTGTSMQDAPVVIGIGPGFTVGRDCHAAVETQRGHYLGTVYYKIGQSPIPNTGVPGIIGGFGPERVMHAPAEGIFRCIRRIGDRVSKGETVAIIGGVPVTAKIDGILRGLLPDGFQTPVGMKCADVDPRCSPDHCFTSSDKARAIGGGVLEAIMRLIIKP